MKKRVWLFVGATVLALLVFPIINLYGNTLNKREKWWDVSAFYNADFALARLERAIYPAGISLNPMQVIIGKNGWLFLGDQYANTITDNRRPATGADIEVAGDIKLAMNSWKQWLQAKGVRQFRILLAPDKETIYPEYLPGWAQSPEHSVIKAFLANVDPNLYFDATPILIKAKQEHREPLYYRTDTHWNMLGAWIAFRSFSLEIARTEKSLRLLSDSEVGFSAARLDAGGDLARLLRMPDVLPDEGTALRILPPEPIKSEHYDFETGALVYSGPTPVIDPPQRPLHVKSAHALNNNKVLWLMDSFGVAIAPYMASTFADIVIADYSKAGPDRLSGLVDSYRPDYVFITVVERESRGAWFLNAPPTLAGTPGTNRVTVSRGIPSWVNDLTKTESADTYRISGGDPFATFTLTKPVRTRDVSQLAFELDCQQKQTTSLKAQVFWRTAKSDFGEADSVRFAVSPGVSAINLSPLKSWVRSEEVTGIRIDINSPEACHEITIRNIELASEP